MIKSWLSQRITAPTSLQPPRYSHWDSHALWNSSAFPQKQQRVQGSWEQHRALDQLLCLQFQPKNSPATLCALWSRENDLAGLGHLLPSPSPSLATEAKPRERLHSRRSKGLPAELLLRHSPSSHSSVSLRSGNCGMGGRDLKVQPWQGHISLSLVVPSPAQPGPGHFQG